MFKLIFVYPFILFVCFWLASDVVVEASIYKFEDNQISMQFPKASFREEGSEPWIDIYWNAGSPGNEIIDIK